jgi:hypothetical protein
MRTPDLVLINFGHLGFPEFLPVEQLEMNLVWSAAERIFHTYAPASVEYLLVTTEAGLIDQATSLGITSDWISSATLTIALRGLRGEAIPDIMAIED